MLIMGALNQYVKEDRGKYIAKLEKIKEEQKREEEKKIPHYYRHEWEELHKNDKADGQNEVEQWRLGIAWRLENAWIAWRLEITWRLEN